jgi:hypothetical protein
MRRRLPAVAFFALVLADAGLLVAVLGFGKDGWWRFALDVTIVALGVNLIKDRWKTRWNRWHPRRKARG